MKEKRKKIYYNIIRKILDNFYLIYKMIILSFFFFFLSIYDIDFNN